MYIRLPKRIVKRLDIPGLLLEYDKISINSSTNKKLYDPSILRITPFILVEKMEFLSLLKLAKSHQNEHSSFLKGMQPCIHSGVIGYKSLKKLIDLKEMGVISFGIPKSFKKILNKDAHRRLTQ